jgi:hypothetical protein
MRNAKTHPIDAHLPVGRSQTKHVLDELALVKATQARSEVTQIQRSRLQARNVELANLPVAPWALALELARRLRVC